MRASDGNFYGTTDNGGTNNHGALYQLSPSGKYQIVYSFTGGNDGGGPYETPLEGSDGNLYGVTNYYGANGGENSGGTIYQYNLSTGSLTTVYSFKNGGIASFGNLIDDGGGTLYGTAGADDPSGSGRGSIWSYNYLTNTFKTLHTFTGTDGDEPLGGVVLATDGNLYGTVECGGSYPSGQPQCDGYGTAFVIATDGSNFHIIHVFSNGAQGQEDGFWPSGTPVEGPDGNIYSFTLVGGKLGNGSGVFFRITPDGTNSTFQAVYSFQAGDGGTLLHGIPFLGGDGNFYMTGSTGGFYYSGQVMQVTSSGKKATVYDFDPAVGDGFNVQFSPFEDADGNLYSGTDSGGKYGLGYLAKFLTTLPPAISLTANSDSVKNGSPVTLTWAVNNAYSLNAKVCIARSTDNSWTGSLSATTGTVSITPSVTNAIVNYAITCGGTETATAQIVVGTTPPQITTGALASGVTRSPYSTKLTELGGVAPFTWSTVSGALPAGLLLDQSSGTISGTPTAVGSFSFTVQLTNSEATPKTATAALNITVVHAPLVTPTTTLTFSPSTVTFGTSSVLTATVSGVAGVPTPAGTVQFSFNNSNLGDPVDLVNGIATLAAPSPTTTGSYGVTAAYSGDSNYTPGAIATGTLLVTAPTTAAITATPISIAITGPGASGSTTLKVVDFPSGSVTFSCTGLPTGAMCNFGTLSATSTSVLQISTTGTSATAIPMPVRANVSRTLFAFGLPAFFAVARLFGRRKRLVRVSGLLMFILLLPFVGSLIGCTNGGGKNGTANTTPEGTSIVTVVATGGGQTASIHLTLTVQ
jgi:uncharacterized repeat protein (TIGR03803 family)